MNSPPLNKTSDSWPELFAAHLQEVQRRSAAALASAGYDSLLLHAGTPPLLFLDDHHLPFRAQAPFKVWAPLNDAPDSFVFFTPGKQPLLLIHQPVDYWHKAPSMPDAYWTGSFDIVSCANPRRRARGLAQGSVAHRVHRRTLPGAAGLGTGGHQSRAPHRTARLRPRREDAVRSRRLREANVLGMRGHVAAERAFRAGASEFEIALEFMKACGQREQELPYNPIVGAQ